MSKEKRFRQMKLSESFLNSKKPRNSPHSLSMEQNLRDLLAAAAEKRISETEEASEINSHHDSKALVLNYDFQVNQSSQLPSTSNEGRAMEMAEIPDSAEVLESSSQELFTDSEELFPTQSIDEVPPTPEETLQHCKSAELFPDKTDFKDSSDFKAEPLSERENNSEDDREMQFLNRIPDCRLPLPKLEPAENHTIMFSPHIRSGVAPRPYPSTYRDFWDLCHVRMPCSPLSKYPVEDLFGEKQIKSRWDLICRSLRRGIGTPAQLEAAIMQYNSQYRDKWNFHALHAFFDQCLDEHERVHFFGTILPVMIDMALELPNICTKPPPLLKKDCNRHLTMSQKQIGCLLLNAFFCTFPRRNIYPRREKYEYSHYPDINFNRLYFGVKNRIVPRNAEKLKCLLNYFRRITTEEPCGAITFHRQSFVRMPDWKSSKKNLKKAIIRSNGLIETDGHGMLQVDFANKFVGGGVLGHGCVQEEIRFVICPELIVSRLFVESLSPFEALIITGVEQYNDYSGYSDTFKWEGDYCDQTSRDSWGRKCTQIVAIDATHFRNTNEQYKSFRIERDLNKAYCGFYENRVPENLSAVATGNWGCGAFNGSPLLKFLIQLMAASQVGRDMVYFTFGNQSLKEELQHIYDIFTEKNLNVGDLWKLLMHFCNAAKVVNYKISPTLDDFICSIYFEENTEESMEDSDQKFEISSSEQLALAKLIEDVNDSSATEMEDNEISVKTDPG